MDIMIETPEAERTAVYEQMRIHDVGPVRFLVLDCPEARNRLDQVMRRELALAVREADADPGCRAIVLIRAFETRCMELKTTAVTGGSQRRLQTAERPAR